LECSMLIVVGIVVIAGLLAFLVMNRKKAKA
jgi:LPXTG-motif cell wall-anchored protein